MGTYRDKENSCLASFQNEGPYWHGYTSGKETELLFANHSDYSTVMNIVAQASAKNPEVSIIAFEVMSNHFHFVVNSEKETFLNFWYYLRKRILRAFSLNDNIKLSIKQISDLQGLRNVIAYTHRNGYVADNAHTPFSYPWGTGRFYYLDLPEGEKYGQLSVRTRREMLRCHDIILPENWSVANGYILPSNYCSIALGMSMFRDAHHYFSLLSKNVEAYSELATELDDAEFLTDMEIFVHITKILKDGYGTNSLKALSKPQKLDIARKLRRDFRSSNGQIRRVLGLPQYEVDNLFPLSAR